MLAYTIRRLLATIPVIGMVALFVFSLLYLTPGDPAAVIAGDIATNEDIERIRHKLGLDEPFLTRFLTWAGAILQGDLGISFQYRSQAVTDLLGVALVNTLWLVLPAQVLGVILGVGLGLLAAWRRRSGIDYGSVAFALLLWALPTFFLGLLLLLFGAGALGLPTGGRATVGAEYATPLDAFADLVAHLILPTATLALVIFGEYLIIMRSSVLDVFSEDYILTAKAKGLTTRRIIRDHALRNAMLPLVTLIALDFGFVVAGAIQTEVVFSWPGLGLLTINAVGQKDYPVLQGTFLLIAVAVVLANLLADLVYGLLDPRVSEASHA